MSAVGRSLLVVLGLFALGATPARAEDLERGKSGPAIFAADCSGCHRSAQGLAYGMSSGELMDLLRQHYTTGPGPANQVATYLLSVVGNGRRPKEKPLTEPRGTVASPGGERPPAEIGGQTATAEPGSAATDRGPRGGAASKRRQQEPPAEPALQGRSKKLGQPTTATRGSEPEPDRPPQPIPVRPSDSVAVRPAEAAGARQQQPSAEAKPAEAAPRTEGAKAEAPTADAGQARPAVPSEASRPAPRLQYGDQSAFSAPSP